MTVLQTPGPKHLESSPEFFRVPEGLLLLLLYAPDLSDLSL